MPSRLLRHIAVSIGAGLATGFTAVVASRSRRPAVRRQPDLHPLFDRLDAIETRVTRVELAPPLVVGPPPEQIDALGTMISAHGEDISLLRDELLAIERRQAEQVEAFSQKLANVEQHVPSQIEARVAARMAELENRLRGEFEDIHARTVDAFARTIETRIVERISLLEHNLISQSEAIVSLREKSARTDDSLQKLLGAVEKLCARAESQANVRILAEQPVSQPVPHAAPVSEADSFAAVYRQELDREHPDEPEPELVYASPPESAARPAHTSSRRGGASIALSILGLAAFVGSRLIR